MRVVLDLSFSLIAMRVERFQRAGAVQARYLLDRLQCISGAVSAYPHPKPFGEVDPSEPDEGRGSLRLMSEPVHRHKLGSGTEFVTCSVLLLLALST